MFQFALAAELPRATDHGPQSGPSSQLPPASAGQTKGAVSHLHSRILFFLIHFMGALPPNPQAAMPQAVHKKGRPRWTSPQEQRKRPEPQTTDRKADHRSNGPRQAQLL